VLLLQKEGLEQLSIAKDNFVASLSHEMRTPLNGDPNPNPNLNPNL
tara:strand:+ start:314 stop:451 length:138 start_codon:yes stop_codon:yes gene_type:complete